MDNAKVISRPAAIARFLICSIIGICVFFVKFPLGGTSVLPIDYINNLFTTWLKGNSYLEVSIFGSALLVYFTVVKKKFWKTAKSNKLAFFFDLMGIMAFVLIILTLLRICPPLFEVNSTLSGAYSLMGKMFIQIMVIMFFIPFLTDYGLPEAIGVFVQPFCRAIWAVPGRVAVIIVSAFLGNFTVGHVQANMYYTSGRVTHREALVMALGFSTPSIGLILSLCSTAGVTDRFPLICGLILVCVLLVTSIVAHIPPLSKYPDEYYEGIKPDPEVYEKGNLLTIAFNTGVETCQKNSEKVPVLQNCRTFYKAFPAVSSVCFVNVTIPYKRALWPYLAGASEAATALGAVNVLRRHHGAWWGENTDVIGFERSLSGWLGRAGDGAPEALRHSLRAAVVLGDGGASAAVQYVLQTLGLPFDVVTRRPRPLSSGPARRYLTYDAWRQSGGFEAYGLCVQTTPVGMFPDVDGELPLPYGSLAVSPERPFYFYDVVYNPEPTAMMRRMVALGAHVKGGLEMLHLQAEAAWEIWQNGLY